jgi:hypothetical protein
VGRASVSVTRCSATSLARLNLGAPLCVPLGLGEEPAGETDIFGKAFASVSWSANAKRGISWQGAPRASRP